MLKIDEVLLINDQINLKLNEQLYLKPEYLNHKFVSGNKLRKLKYNIQKAQELKLSKLLTFGGAFSNHIAAVAAAGNEFGFETIGIIRGEELANERSNNPTLDYAEKQGMHLHFITREVYRQKSSSALIEQLESRFGAFYHIPEGGTNALAVKGCEDMLTQEDDKFDYICCPVGTGGTISGLINSSLPEQNILGFPALKGDFLKTEIQKYTSKTNWELINDYHFGGYAKINTALIEFINGFKNTFGIALDPIYTGKMMYGIYDLLKKGYFKNDSKILAIHTGGLQGIAGMNMVLEKKSMPLID